MLEEENHITRIERNGKEYIIIGTAHVSKSSAELVKQVIEQEQPDSVCIELDQQRYESIRDGSKWKEMDIFKVIKEKKATLLIMNLAISSFQKRMAKQFGIEAGQEMIQGIQSAEEIGATLVLADRNIQITFSRIWSGVDLKGKLMLLTQIIASIFSNETITEEELEKLKEKDSINAILDEFTEHFPQLKKPLVDERDQYLAEKIKRAPGNKVVAVLGAAHVPGVTREIDNEHDLKALTTVPKKKNWKKRLGWIIPILIVSLMASTFLLNPDAGWQQMKSWLIWNGTFAGIGTIAAFGHPLAILTAVVSSPFTSLNPFIAAGILAGMVQAYFNKPQVSDFESLSDDVHTAKGFWKNKVTRVLLVVILANLGSTLGTIVAGTDVIRLFFENIF